MDLTTIIAFIVALGLVVFGGVNSDTGIDFTRINYFLDASSAAITFGGTIMATVMSFPISAFKDIPKHMKIIVGGKKYDPIKYIGVLVDCAKEARRKGILALEDKAAEQKDKFLQESIMLIVDAIEPEKVREILDNELDLLDDRHSKGCKIYDKASSYAPSFGMIGTLLGLIAMLRGTNLSAEGGADGMVQGMAVALITTLYGSLIANMVFVPISTKLKERHAEEMLCKEMIVEGVLAIGAGDNPKHIEERLYAYLKSTDKEKQIKKGGAGGDDGGEDGGSKPAKVKKK